jgi:hypothetical protein
MVTGLTIAVGLKSLKFKEDTQLMADSNSFVALLPFLLSSH